MSSTPAVIGIADFAMLKEVKPCPKIKPGAGRVVMMTINSMADRTIKLEVRTPSGLTTSIDATPNHPLYSEDRQEYVRPAN